MMNKIMKWFRHRKPCAIDTADIELRPCRFCGGQAIFYTTNDGLKDDKGDALEVMPGRWEQDYQDKWRCSKCKAGNMYAFAWDIESKDYTKLQDKYCPNCGAKMEETE